MNEMVEHDDHDYPPPPSDVIGEGDPMMDGDDEPVFNVRILSDHDSDGDEDLSFQPQATTTSYSSQSGPERDRTVVSCRAISILDFP